MNIQMRLYYTDQVIFTQIALSSKTQILKGKIQ